MKNILYFIAGVLFVTLVSATTVNVMTVKPQLPISIIVHPFRVTRFIENDITNFVKEKVKQGYVVKSITISEDKYTSKGIVIMEKY